jgi:hypothetical protein
VLILTKDCKVSEIRSDVHKFGTQYVFRIIWPPSSGSELELLKKSKSKDSSMLNFSTLSIAVFGVIAGSFTSGTRLFESRRSCTKW